MSEEVNNVKREPEDWEKLPEPDLNWDKFQRILYADLHNVDANIRSAALQQNGQLLLALQGMRSQIIGALAMCEFNKPRKLF